MESELARYRARRRLEDYKTSAATKVCGIWDSFTDRLTRALLPNNNDNEENAENANEDGINPQKDKNRAQRKLKKPDRAQGLKECGTSAQKPPPTPMTKLELFQLFLKCLTWLFTWAGFIKCGWGSVFFVISGLVFIWWNLRSSSRSAGEPSAYSVFNPGCEELDGTLSAAKLEKQLLFR